MGSFIAPALRAGMSAAGLVYFFAPAIFDFWIGNPQHIGVMVGFFAYLGDCDAVDPKYPGGDRQLSHHLKRDEQEE
jgi:hypothetical protein